MLFLQFPDNELMQSVRKFDQSQLRQGVPPPPPLPPLFDHIQLQHGVPDAPPPPPLPPSLTPPQFAKHNMIQQGAKFTIGDSEESYSNESKPDLPSSNFLSPTPAYLNKPYSSPTATSTHKQFAKTSSLPYGAADFDRKGIPQAPPPPHLPIRRQPSALLREIRKTGYINRRSGHNLGPYNFLRHVEPVEKRAFRVGRVVGEPAHVVTLQEVIRSFNKRHLKEVTFVEPQPNYPVGKVVPKAPVHVPKMKGVFSKKPVISANKREPNRLKKSKAIIAAPEDELPRIPTPPLTYVNEYPVTKDVKTKYKKKK